MRNILFNGYPSCMSLKVRRPKCVYKRVEDSSELNRLCSLVYASDSRTHLPTGDLQLFFSDKVNPDIKDWVSRQLLQPVEFGDVSSNVHGTQLDDDTILACMRKRGESSHDYVDRINNYLRSINSKGD